MTREKEIVRGRGEVGNGKRDTKQGWEFLCVILCLD